MIKPIAKRNRRQRKKLKVDEWRQWTFYLSFEYDQSDSALEIESIIIDTLYDIADYYECWMGGFISNMKSDFAFHNYGLLDKGVNCQIAMARKLNEIECVSNIQVGFKESLD